MHDLIQKLEKATEGSNALDWEIAEEVMHGEIYATPPRYTTSLDAALSLVPEGWIAESVGYYRDDPNLTGDGPVVGHAELCADPIYNGISINITAATPAIALVIACLKARADDQPRHDPRKNLSERQEG